MTTCVTFLLYCPTSTVRASPYRCDSSSRSWSQTRARLPSALAPAQIRSPRIAPRPNKTPSYSSHRPSPPLLSLVSLLSLLRASSNRPRLRAAARGQQLKNNTVQHSTQHSTKVSTSMIIVSSTVVQTVELLYLYIPSLVVVALSFSFAAPCSCPALRLVCVDQKPSDNPTPFCFAPRRPAVSLPSAHFIVQSWRPAGEVSSDTDGTDRPARVRSPPSDENKILQI